MVWNIVTVPYNREHPRLSQAQTAGNPTQSKVGAKVELRFHIMKRILGFTQEGYRGPGKETDRVQVPCVVRRSSRRSLRNLF